MSAFAEAVKERERAVDERAAQYVRNGIPPWQALMEAGRSVDAERRARAFPIARVGERK